MGHYETVDKHHTVLFECCADSAHTVYLLAKYRHDSPKATASLRWVSVQKHQLRRLLSR